MRIQTIAILLLLPILANATDHPLNLDLGRYTGVDTQGQHCSIFIIAGFGQTIMDTFEVNAGWDAFRIFTGRNPTTKTPGVYETNKRVMMYDGVIDGLNQYRTFFGGPIGAQLSESDTTIKYRNGKPTSYTLIHYAFNGSPTQPYATYHCRNLRK